MIEFKAHSHILEISSEYYKKALATNFKDSQLKRIEVQGDEKCVKAELEFLYTEKVKHLENPEKFSIQELFDLLEISETHLNEKLSTTCLYYIDQRATLEEKMSILLSIQACAQEAVLELLLQWVENDPDLISSFCKGIFNCNEGFYKSVHTIASKNNWEDIRKKLEDYNTFSNICPETFIEEKTAEQL